MKFSLRTPFIVCISLLALTTVLSGCSSKKAKASGDMKKTQYCERYREFDEKVATATPTEQKKLLTAITQAKDFPQELKDEYTLVLSGYDLYLQGESVRENEKEYASATKAIARHAIEHCEVLKSNTGGGTI